MISEERLKELIEKRADIYFVYSTKNIKLKLNEKCYIDENAKQLVYVPDEDDCQLFWDSVSYMPFSKIYETDEEAKWAGNFKQIARTEYLDLPTWKEFKKRRHFSFPDQNNCTRCILILTNDTIEKHYNKDCIYLYNPTGNNENLGLANKRNYIKACEMAKRLFLGEEEQNNE